jgi:putative flippase GtrA
MQQHYPAVRFVVRHGAIVTWLVPALLAAAGLAGLLLHWGPWISLAFLVGAAVLFCVLRLVVELVQIIADTLLPQ